MPFPRIRFSLAQLLLLVALSAIVVSASILVLKPSGTPHYVVTSVAFSADGKTLAASLYVFHSVQAMTPDPRVLGADATKSFFLLEVPDLVSQQLERTARPGKISVAGVVRKLGEGQSLAFSPDGSRLATKGLENRVSLWDVKTCKKLRDLTAAGVFSGGVSWAENGTLAISAYNAVYVLKPNGEKLQQLTSRSHPVTVALSRDGKRLATVDDEGGIDLWDGRSGSHLYQLQKNGFGFDKEGIAFSPDGHLIAGSLFTSVNFHGDAKMSLWDTETGQQRRSWEAPWPMLAVTFSPDSERLVAADCGGALHVYYLNDSRSEDVQTDQRIASVAFSPDGKLLATGDWNGGVSLWDAQTMRLMRRTSLVDSQLTVNWLVVISAGFVWLALWIHTVRRQRRAAMPA